MPPNPHSLGIFLMGSYNPLAPHLFPMLKKNLALCIFLRELIRLPVIVLKIYSVLEGTTKKHITLDCSLFNVILWAIWG